MILLRMQADHKELNYYILFNPNQNNSGNNYYAIINA